MRDKANGTKVVRRALELVTEAMDLLDAHGVKPKAASYLALAQQELRTLEPLQ
jgi:hypothetical protein